MFTCKRSLALRRGLALCAALGAWLAFAGTSQAAPEFPQDLADQLNMPCLPPCTICHQDLNGGFNTVVKPFGNAMRAQGLTFIASTLAPALAKVEANKTDSDGDGVDDVLELSAGRDPNTGAELCGADAPPVPRYGCGAHIANVPSPDHSGPVAALLVATVLGASAHRSARRRRAKRRT